MVPTHDQAQRESQPVPYWAGQENPLIDAIEKGMLRPSVDFDEHGVLDIKDAKPLGATVPKPLPYQAQRLEVRMPLGRLDKATGITPPPTLPPTVAPAPAPAPDAAVEVLCAEIAALELANTELARENAAIKTYADLLGRVTGGFIDLWEHEHRRA